MKRLAICLLILCPIFLSGCIFDTILNDFVNQAPRAVVDVDAREGSAPMTVTFDAHYSHDDGQIVDFHWDFGDPNDRTPKRQETATHTYRHAGTYLSTLTVIDDEGATDSQQVAIIVTNPPPVPQILVSSESPLPGREVVFDATTSYDPDGTIVSFHWDFGDTVTAEGENVRHTYASGGYKVVTLTLTDDEGATASTHIGLNVLPGQSECADETTCGGGDPQPLAIIEAWPNPTSCGGVSSDQPIKFSGAASRPGTGTISTYYWEFGDGATAIGRDVTHTYTRGGGFRIKLTVTNDSGATDVATMNADINSSTCGP